MAIQTVTIVGGGLMGCGIAQVFAACPDFTVCIQDTFVSEADMTARIRGNLDMLVGRGVLPAKDAEAMLARIHPTASLAEAVVAADLVVECIPENMALKQALFAQLETLCPPHTRFATNTSVMSITEIGATMKDRSRLVGTHFWNPPYLIPLVEVVRSSYTADEVVEDVMWALECAGKHPIRVNKDVPGFVANRLQHALWREAISIVEHGIADAQTVDEAVRLSFGLRLPVLAPLENADMVGNDLALSIHTYLLPFLENGSEPSPLLAQHVAEGKLGFKSGEGFFRWTPEGMEQSRRKLTDHLIRMLYGKD